MLDRLGSGGATLEGFDLCVVGAGAAGLALAAEFADGPQRVLVLESGLEFADAGIAQLNSADILGLRHDGAVEGRVRALGGTTTAWGGQLMRLRDSELAARDWVPRSGWPLDAAALAPWYERAERLMGVVGPPYDRSGAASPSLAALPLAPEFELRHSQWATLGRRNLAVLLRRRLRASRHVTILLDATVTELETSPDGGHVEMLHVRGRDGRRQQVRAARYVLCCGGIETPRLLLASRQRHPHGVANRGGLVGRCFQDHVSCFAAELLPADRRRVAALFDPRFRGRTMYTAKLEPSDAAQRRHRLLNVMGHLAFEIPTALGMLEARRMLRELQRGRVPVPSIDEFAALLRGSGQLARLLAARLLAARRASPTAGRIMLLVDVEQVPDPDSRVTLASRLDPWGEPLAAIRWQVGDLERDTLARYTAMLGAEFERLGLGEVRSCGAPDFEVRDRPGAARDIFHHMGTARMSATPAGGVVDPTLRCHEVDNLWIAGGAVFPAGGIANPTLTILALALRLAAQFRSGSR